ncbi:MAG: hypothetical protein H0T43_08915 [Solirubrobacterales bacterium]|nr:hypothetical protein [Solirubrobacterales bacterium]
MAARFARTYGAGPLHLLTALASFAIAGYAVVEIRELGAPGSVAVWFIGALVAHDLVLLPLYSLVERSAARLTRVNAVQAKPGAPAPPGILLINHLRVPAMLSGLLFLLFFPAILQRNDGYIGASGLAADVYLGRWLALTAALFVLSGLLYAIRRGRSAAAYPEP